MNSSEFQRAMGFIAILASILTGLLLGIVVLFLQDLTFRSGVAALGTVASALTIWRCRNEALSDWEEM